MSRLLTEIMFVQAAAQNKDHQVTHVCSEAEENTEEKLLSLEKFFLLPVKSSLSHVTNRCVITNRKKRINKLYSFSRISFLKLEFCA